MRTEKLFKHSFIGRLLPFYFFGFLLLALLFACEEKPDFIGGDLLPSGDNFTVSFDSMELVYGYTRYGDSIPSNFKTYHLLGSIVDPFFGSSRAEIVTTVSSSPTSMGFGNNVVADSVILFLTWEDWTGEGSLPLQLHLYEFAEFFHSDTSYYSNMDMSGRYKEPELGSASISQSDTIIKIYITNQEFIEKFLTADDSILKSFYYVQELMYGLYLTTDDAVDDGGIARFDFDNAGNYLNFYYSNDTADGLTQYYSLNNSSNGRINMFRHDHSGYPLENFLGTGSDNDSLIFLQSMVGVNPVIRFPELTRWIDSMPVAINEARLIFTMADTVLTMQRSKYFPESVNMFLVTEEGNYFQTYDYILDPGSFGGGYDDDSQTYSYTIKVQMQSILRGDVENLNMVLVPANLSQSVSRAVLYGWNTDPMKRIRLEVTYTEL